MKKIKRFTILSVMALAVFFFFGTASVKASAETPEISVMESASEEVVDSEEEMQNSSVFETETSEETTSEYFEVIPETETSKWFEENVQPHLLTLGFAFAGVIGALMFLFRKTKKMFKVFEFIKGVFDNAVATFTESKKENLQMQSSNETWKKETKAELRKEMAEMKALTEETHNTVKRLEKVNRIVYVENPSMVANGTSHKVAEVLSNEET